MIFKTKKLLLLPILLILTSCYNQECNCKQYKTGKFEFVQEIDGIKKTTIFERTENLQIETYEGKTDTAQVRWVNDCEFVLQKINVPHGGEVSVQLLKIFLLFIFNRLVSLWFPTTV